MVQRYVKFGNFRSPVAASFAALQKVRSAPPVTGFLSSTFCCSLSAVRCPLSAVRCPLSAVRCSLFAARRLLSARLHSPPPAVRRLLPVPTVRRLLFAARYSPPTLHGPPPRSAARRPPFAACCLCLLFAAYCSPPATLRPPSTVRLHGPPPAVRRSPLVACAYCSPPAVCRPPSAVCCPLFVARHHSPPLQSATRCLPPALCRPLPQPADRRLSFATLRPLLSARYSPPATLRPPPLPATLRLPPQPAITTRRPQTAAARVDSSPANPLLSGYALNRPHMCAKRRSMLFCLASDVVETEFLFIFVQINKGKQLFIPLADRGTSSGDCLNRVWLLSVLCYASTSWWGRHGHGTIFLFRLLEACIERDRLALFCWKQSRAVIIPGRRPPLHHGRDF